MLEKIKTFVADNKKTVNIIATILVIFGLYKIFKKK